MFKLLTLEQFQSTLPRGERLEPNCFLPNFWKFQSTLPRGERRNLTGAATWEQIFQSTLPRGERHRPLVSIILVILISIHAPARGATSINPFFSSSTINFNPRSREGSDTTQIINNHYIINFNPRSREGSDLAPFFVFQLRRHISIHAPARGATSAILLKALQ